MRHRRTADFAAGDPLLEITDRDIAPDVSCEIEQNRIQSNHGMKEFSDPIVGFDLGGERVDLEPQSLDETACQFGPIDIWVRHVVCVVVAYGTVALAQQFGLSLGSGSSERTPEFYEALVTSSEILRQTVVRRHPVRGAEGEPGEIDLIEYYEVDEETEAGRIERAMEELIEDDLEVTTDRDAGIVSFSITTTYPSLSYGVAAHVLELVNDFSKTAPPDIPELLFKHIKIGDRS